MLARGFEIRQDALDDLREEGLDEDLLSALGTLAGHPFKSGGELLGSLSKNVKKPVPRKDAKLILKASRRSLLRLEKLIPHRSTREWVEALIYAVVLAVIVRTFVFAPFKIPSGSMIPTIEIGDHIFATMYSYGIHVPFTDYKLFPSEISRGDIIIFPFPDDPSVDYIKRVIAVGGDTVEVRGKEVYINGELQKEPFAYYDPERVLELAANGSRGRNYPPQKVPPGHLFMMGDNRLNSSDSRVWGFVDTKTVKGKGRIVYLSHDPEKSLFSGWRFDRLGTILR